MRLALFLIAIAAGFVKPRQTVTLFLQLAIFTFLAVSNSGNADYDNYRLTYEYIGSQEIYGLYFQLFEPGYKVLAQSASSLGLDFNQFRAVLVVISSFIFYRGLVRWSHGPAMFSFYLCFPGLLDIVQIRNLLAGSLIFYAYSCLILSGEQSKFNVLRSLAILGVAASVQITSAVYIVAIVLYLLIRQSSSVKLFGIIILASSLVYLQLRFSQILNMDRIQVYLDSATSRITFVGSTVVICFILFFLRDTFRRISPSMVEWYLFVVPLSTAVFLTYYNVEFLRIYRNLLLPVVGLFLSHGMFVRPIFRSAIASVPFAFLFLFVAGMETVVKPILFSP